MQVSQTYNYEKNDHINRANMALVCAKYFNIKDVSPDLYRIAAPVCELACFNKNGERIYNRFEIEDAIPWNERSLKTFGVVYRYESTASFISTDGKTYVVPNDRPVLDYLKECGYVIAPNGLNFDGSTSKNDSLVFEEKDEYLIDYNIIDRNLPKKIVEKMDEIEGGRPYFTCKQDYAALIRFGGTLGIMKASEEELKQLSLSERKIINISTYGRVNESQKIEDYVQFVLQKYYLDDQNFVIGKRL